MGASCLTGIINCQIRKENPKQTLSDFLVDFHVVRPGDLGRLTKREVSFNVRNSNNTLKER
jgi:hypothetical protein